ncbi:MAG: tripartite tricarboxylate transporter permease [Candidatus Nanohaloarchaea archaeon]
MLEYLIIITLGVIAGVFTGLIPGIHPNTVIFGSLPFYFSSGIDSLVFLSFLSGLSVSHTFHDFLPAIFIGAPEAESALSTLPGKQMAERGRGLEAFRYTATGGLFSVLVLVAVSPLLFLFLKPVYSIASQAMGLIVLFFLVFIFFSSRNRFYSALIILFSGLTGLISFDMAVNGQFVMVPIFTGLFAVPELYASYRGEKIPEQYETSINRKKAFKGGFTGFLAGLLAGTVPGIGGAVSTSFLAPLIDSSKRRFLAAMGAVNTSDIITSFIVLAVLAEARSGASVALHSIMAVNYRISAFLIGASLFSVGASFLLAFKVSRLVVKLLDRVDFSSICVLAFLAILGTVFGLTGFQGLLILATSSSIGFIASLTGERKSCMAVLLVPVLLYFVGSGIFI